MLLLAQLCRDDALDKGVRVCLRMAWQILRVKCESDARHVVHSPDVQHDAIMYDFVICEHYILTKVVALAARVKPVYRCRLAYSLNTQLSSNSTVVSHCEPCDLCTVMAYP